MGRKNRSMRMKLNCLRIKKRVQAYGVFPANLHADKCKDLFKQELNYQSISSSAS